MNKFPQPFCEIIRAEQLDGLYISCCYLAFPGKLGLFAVFLLRLLELFLRMLELLLGEGELLDRLCMLLRKLILRILELLLR